MARFEPLPGIRYDLDAVDLAKVVAPPYDVIDDHERDVLAARYPANVVHIDLPRAEPGGRRYEVAGRLFREWQDRGPLRTDDEPSFYVYRMDYRDEAGIERQTSGVMGALELDPAEGPRILPHEQTTPKARSDRLQLMRSCRANLSPIWGLSPTEGLSALCELQGPPLARWLDGRGVNHRFWQLTQPAQLEAVSSAVEAGPVLIADGHHRYSTSLTYRDERRDADGPGPWDSLLAFVVELADDQLTVQPIHRLLSSLPPDLDLPAALTSWFEVTDAGTKGPEIARRLVDEEALGLIIPSGNFLLRPRPELLAAASDLDSSRLDVALAGLPDHEVNFQSGAGEVQRLVDTGTAQAGVLLRPATVDQIAATAHGGELMPPKTTYFYPKPNTGVVFRSLD